MMTPLVQSTSERLVVRTANRYIAIKTADRTSNETTSITVGDTKLPSFNDVQPKNASRPSSTPISYSPAMIPDARRMPRFSPASDELWLVIIQLRMPPNRMGTDSSAGK